MKGQEMKQIRQLARAIGYTGTDRNDEMRVRQYEYGKKQIPLYIARLVWLMDREHRNAVPFTTPPMQSGVIRFPDWPGYEFDHTPDAVAAK